MWFDGSQRRASNCTAFLVPKGARRETALIAGIELFSGDVEPVDLEAQAVNEVLNFRAIPERGDILIHERFARTARVKSTQSAYSSSIRADPRG
jgi:hypothetical protein